MNNIETMKLALEALRTLHDENMDYLTRNKLGGENNQCMVFAREAITALRQAIEQAQKQEPVGQLCEETYGRGQVMWFNKPVDGSYVYTSPPPRQPLTDEELKKTWYDMKNIMGWYSFQEIARVIEAAHGIKENT